MYLVTLKMTSDSHNSFFVCVSESESVFISASGGVTLYACVCKAVASQSGLLIRHGL